MSEVFDPYHKWLGIAPEEQPADRYRLLGIRRFESDPEVIANAADQRMGLVRSFQGGPHTEASQELLNELAAARVCLLSPRRKKQYDGWLRERLPADPEPAGPPEPPPDTSGTAPDSVLWEFVQRVGHEAERPRSTGRMPAEGRKRGLTRPTPIMAGASLVLVLAAGLLIALRSGEREAPRPGKIADGAVSGVTPSNVFKAEHAGHAPEPAVLILRWPESQREGARLRIDGYRMTPSASSAGHLEFGLGPGEHRVRILREGCVAFDETLTLAPGEKADKTVTFQPVVKSDGTGLLAEYYNGRQWEELKLKRVDPKVHFFWGTRAPDESLPADDFSVRWTGYLKAPFPGRYKLLAECDDAMQLQLDGKTILWGSHGSDRHPEAEVELTGKPQSLQIQYWEEAGGAVMCLNWIPPGKYVEHAVPHEALFHNEKVAEATPVDASILHAAPSGDPTQLSSGRPLDLLRLIDPTAHVVKGRWWFDGEALVCGWERPAAIQIPVTPLGEHSVRAEVQRLTGACEFVLSSTMQRRPLSLVLDTGDDVSGVELIDGQRVDGNETRHAQQVFAEGQARTVDYLIGRDRLTVGVDSETVIDWKPSYSRCSLCSNWAVSNQEQLSLCAWESHFRISKLELTPLSSLEDKLTEDGDSAEAEIAQSVLESDPRNSLAQLFVGLHYCVAKKDWTKGLSHLAQCNDRRVRDLAIRDSRTRTPKVDAQIILGDAWWDLAESANGLAREAFRIRAEIWYRSARKQLVAGRKTARIDERLRLVDPDYDASQSHFGIRFGGSAFATTHFVYDGRMPITLEAIVRANHVHKSTIAGNMQFAGLGLEIHEGRWAFTLHDAKIYRYAVSDDEVTTGRWTHLAGVYDGQTLRLFVDGRLQRSSPLLDTPHRSAPFPMMLGADPDARGQPEHPFFGTIAGFHVTNGVLYYQDFTPGYPLRRCGNSVMLLLFKEGEGRSAADGSGKGQSATLKEAEWTALTDLPSWNEVTDRPAALDTSNANEPWAREWKVAATREGADSQGFRETINESSTRGATGVLGIHPVEDAQPARIARQIHLNPHDRLLCMRLTSTEAGDFALLVKANGIPLHKAESISGNRGWRELNFDLTAFAKQDVQLDIEVHNTGWYCEHAFFDSIAICPK